MEERHTKKDPTFMSALAASFACKKSFLSSPSHIIRGISVVWSRSYDCNMPDWLVGFRQERWVRVQGELNTTESSLQRGPGLHNFMLNWPDQTVGSGPRLLRAGSYRHPNTLVPEPPLWEHYVDPFRLVCAWHEQPDLTNRKIIRDPRTDWIARLSCGFKYSHNIWATRASSRDINRSHT